MTTAPYRRIFLMGLILIALGVALSNTAVNGALGTVMIALGGYCFIAAMARKRQEGNPH